VSSLVTRAVRKHLQASKRPVATSASTLYCAQAMNRVWRFLILGRNKGSVPIVNVVRLTGGRQHRSNLVWRTQDWQDTRRRPASCRLCLKTFQDTAQRRDPGADAAGAGTRGQAAYQLRPGPPPRRLRRAARRPAGPRRARVLTAARAQAEPWLQRAFKPPLATLKPAAVAVTINSPGAPQQVAGQAHMHWHGYSLRRMELWPAARRAVAAACARSLGRPPGKAALCPEGAMSK